MSLVRELQARPNSHLPGRDTPIEPKETCRNSRPRTLFCELWSKEQTYSKCQMMEAFFDLSEPEIAIIATTSVKGNHQAGSDYVHRSCTNSIHGVYTSAALPRSEQNCGGCLAVRWWFIKESGGISLAVHRLRGPSCLTSDHV